MPASLFFRKGGLHIHSEENKTREHYKMKEIILAGLPNCGKSTLFSLLTGIHAVTGNREGVTVTAKSGKMMMKNREKVLLTDLPGIRRIPPRAPDEQLSVARLHDRSYDLLLYVTDVGNLANGLELLRDLLHCPAATCQACMSCEVECQVLLVVNFCDDLIRMGPSSPAYGILPDGMEHTPEKLEKALHELCGIPVCCISGRTQTGIPQLRRVIEKMLENPEQKQTFRLCLEKYRTLSKRPKVSSAHPADRILLSPFWGSIILAMTLTMLFFLTFGPPTGCLTDFIERWTAKTLLPHCASLLYGSSLPVFFADLLCDGILPAVISVIAFLPRLGMLFLCLGILEESGYSARVAHLVHPMMYKIGLSGDAFIPLLLGCGCTVTGVLATRTFSDRTLRRRTLLFLPLISCSARIALYSLLADICMPAYPWIFCLILYLLGFVLLCLFARICKALQKTKENNPAPLPVLRVPSPAVILSDLLDRLRHFLGRIGGIILLSGVLVWLLAHIGLDFRYLPNGGQNTLLERLGAWFVPFLKPLGLGNSAIAVSLLSGVLAKEAFVSTYAIVSGGIPIAQLLSPASAISLAVFYALYLPCTATVCALHSEKVRRGDVIFSCLLCLSVAWLSAFTAYRLFL